jgi:bifunctional non-homologous end joining protein LigD
VVALTNTQLLQRFQKQPTALTLYFALDLLWTNGVNITGKHCYGTSIRAGKHCQTGRRHSAWELCRGEGKALFDLAKSKGMEGIVAKRKDSVYRPGKRSADWLKIKSRPQQEFVVGGFTEGKGSRKHLGALLLGAYRNGKLHYFGHSGSGFSEKGLRDALDRMKPLFTDKSPFENPLRIPEKIQWVKPKLVCEISFAEWTRGGELRQTVFLGWREDKNPKEVVLERQ